MVGVVQLVERQVVILNVAGSSPVTHPKPETVPYLHECGWGTGRFGVHATSYATSPINKGAYPAPLTAAAKRSTAARCMVGVTLGCGA